MKTGEMKVGATHFPKCVAPDRTWSHPDARYPAYKDSGIEWLGEIPSHWEVRRLKYVAGINTDTLSENTDPDYILQYVDISSVDSNGSILETQEMRFENAPSRARRKTRQNDTIISTVRTYLKAIAFIDDQPDNLIVSTGFAVLHPHPELAPKYLWRWVQSQGFVGAVVVNSEGIGYPAITSTRLGELSVVIPPLPEQRAIAAYLDCETARLDAAIAETRRLIDLLRERRSALIAEVVTKGLVPAAPRKDSGIEWLGEIPEHWRVFQFKYVAEISYGLTLELDRTETEGTPIISLPNVTKVGQLLLDDVPLTPLTNEQKTKLLLHKGDLLFNWRNGSPDHVGKTAYFDAEGEYTHVSFLLRLRFGQRNHEPRYYHMFLVHLRSIGFFSSSKSRINTSYNQTELGHLQIISPPLEEQRAIAAYLDRETAHIDAAVSEAETLIAYLEEYRAALIAAAVTGKIQVQQVQRT